MEKELKKLPEPTENDVLCGWSINCSFLADLVNEQRTAEDTNFSMEQAEQLILILKDRGYLL